MSGLDPIPDVWPPPQTEDAVVAPMFPLPGVFLFPRQLMPLQIFEPRYVQMIEHGLDGPGRLVMATVLENEESGPDEAEPPRVLPIAGIGEIARHEKTEDGRYYIVLYGLGRVRIDEMPCEHTYRRVTCTPLEEVPAPAEVVDALRRRLVQAILARSPELLNLPDDMPTGFLADLLAQRLQLPQSEMEPIFSEYHVARRARMALAADRRHPRPPSPGPT